MLFQRKHKPGFWKRVAAYAWPRSGYRRAAIYVAHRVRRLPGTPYSVAAGLAAGAAVSFTPFLGFHFILAAIIAYAIRGNIFASAVGTAVGNPWTFPFIWAWIYLSGRWILGRSLDAALPSDLSFAYIFDHPWQLLWPMTVGGLITALVAWVIFFVVTRQVVAGYQKAQRMRLLRRRERLRKLRRFEQTEGGGRKAGRRSMTKEEVKG